MLYSHSMRYERSVFNQPGTQNGMDCVVPVSPVCAGGLNLSPSLVLAAHKWSHTLTTDLSASGGPSICERSDALVCRLESPSEAAVRPFVAAS